MMDTLCDKKISLLQQILRKCGRDGLLICYSGGVDSTLAVAVAARAGISPLLALTFATPTVARDDLDCAVAAARELNISQRVQDIDTLAIPEVAANAPERCYHCKLALYNEAQRIAGEEGYACVADGCNAEDLLAFRPGNRAATERGIRHPLAEAGLDKAEIRSLAAILGLSNHNRPASPCLASRFPYETPINEENIRRVEEGESYLRRLGLDEFRLRSHGDLARLEVPPDKAAAVLGHKGEICAELRRLGFRHIALDLEDFSSGSFDRK